MKENFAGQGHRGRRYVDLYHFDVTFGNGETIHTVAENEEHVREKLAARLKAARRAIERIESGVVSIVPGSADYYCGRLETKNQR